MATRRPSPAIVLTGWPPDRPHCLGKLKRSSRIFESLTVSPGTINNGMFQEPMSFVVHHFCIAQTHDWHKPEIAQRRTNVAILVQIDVLYATRTPA